MKAASSSKPASSRLFTGLSIFLIAVLSLLACWSTQSIIITQPSSRQVLSDALADPLTALAISRARALDPKLEWIIPEKDADTAISDYMKETVLNNVRVESDPLAADPNLSWVITYDGNDYRHNWKDSFNTETGALNFSIRSESGKGVFTGSSLPQNLFDRDRSILINPTLVPPERLQTGNTAYTYRLQLPADFAIHYYIPAHIESNGGTIAKIAANLNGAGMMFACGLGSVVIILFALVYRYRSESGYRPLRQFVRLKALFAWLLGIGGTIALLAVNEYLRLAFSSGTLSEFYESIGFAARHADLASAATSIALWAAYFYLLELTVLYFKYVQAKGLKKYLQEDSLTSYLIVHYREKLIRAFEPSHLKNPGIRTAGACILIIFVMMAAMLAGGLLFGVPGLILGALLSFLFLAVLFAAAGKVQARHYNLVQSAASHLAKGDFDHLQPADAGMYQDLYDELMHVSDSYEKALKEGLASQISKTQLISNVSHDLKTPIAGILSYSELIRQTDSMEDIRSYSKRLDQYASRLTDLIEDLFNVAKATSGDIQLDLHDIDLTELVLQVESEWEDALEAKELSVVFDLMPSAVIRLDPSHMVRVIENLLSNICKYSLAHSRVFISLHEENGLYMLIFKNTSKTQMDFSPDQIVERFVRGDASRHESGSGIGLAIVKSFVEVMSGTFEVQIDGDLFKACISFPVPPMPKVPKLPEAQEEEPETEEAPAVPDTLETDKDSFGQNTAQSGGE